MPLFTWQQDSIIEQADLRQNMRYRYALLRVKDGVPEATLKSLIEKLQKHNLVVMPDAQEGHALLRIRNFEDFNPVIDALRKEGLVQGLPNVAATPLDTVEAQSTQQWIKENSIPLTGAFYLIADLMPMGSGLVRREYNEVMQGAAWGITSIVLMLCGKKNPNFQMGNIYGKVENYLLNEGVDLSENETLSLDHLRNKPGFANSIVNFFYEHPVEFNNTLQAYGGIKQAQAGAAQENWYKTIAGGSCAAGMAAGVVIPEDKYAGLAPEDRAKRIKDEVEGKPPEPMPSVSFWSDPVTAVLRKPLILAGSGPFLGNILTGLGALFNDRPRVNRHFGIETNTFELNPVRLVQDIFRGSAELEGILKTRLDGIEGQIAATRADMDSGRIAPSKGITTLEALQKQFTEAKTAGESEILRHMGWKFNLASPWANMVANTLYAMSSKADRSVNLARKGYLDELYTLAASIYSHVPEDERAEKIHRFSGFLSSQPDILANAVEIEKAIVTKITEIEKSPWANLVKSQAAAPAQGVQVGA